MSQEWLAQEVRARGLLHKEVAEVVGWHQSAVSKVLAGERRMLADEMLKLMEYFGYPLPWDARALSDESVTLLSRVESLSARHRRALAVYLETLVDG